jgi:hypothetical protein
VEADPPPPPVEEIVWFGQLPETVTFAPAIRLGLAVPVPPFATESGKVKLRHDPSLLRRPVQLPPANRATTSLNAAFAGELPENLTIPVKLDNATPLIWPTVVLKVPPLEVAVTSPARVMLPLLPVLASVHVPFTQMEISPFCAPIEVLTTIAAAFPQDPVGSVATLTIGFENVPEETSKDPKT